MGPTNYAVDPAEPRKANSSRPGCDSPADIHADNAASIDMDRLLQTLGTWGRYQLIQSAVLLLTGVPVAFPVLCGAFTGKHMDPVCLHNSTDTRHGSNSTSSHPITSDNISQTGYNLSSMELNSCEIAILDNSSLPVRRIPCEGFDYTEDKSASYISEWNLVCDRSSLAQLPQMLTMLGMMVGASTLPQIGDRFGRKLLNVVSHFSVMVSMVTMAYAPFFELFLFFNFLSGCLDQGLMIPQFISMLELIPKDSRSIVGFLYSAQWSVSVMLLAPLAYVMRHAGWRRLQLVYGLASSLSLVALVLLDESLLWLLLNGKVGRARKLLRKACSTNRKNYTDVLASVLKPEAEDRPFAEKHGPQLVEEKGWEDEKSSEALMELKLHQEELEVYTAGQTFLVLLKTRVLRKMSLIVCFCWMVNSMTYYGLTLLSTSMAGDPYLNFVLSGLMDFPASILMFYSLNRFGRKLTVMSFLSSAGLFLLAAVIMEIVADTSGPGAIIQTACTLAGKFFISGSFNAIWIYTPELYPTNIRNVGIGISSGSARVIAIITPFFSVMARNTPWLPGAIFSVCCVLSAFLLHVLPETNGRPLPSSTTEVEAWFRSDRKAKNSPTVS